MGRVEEIPVKIANSPSTTNTEAFMSSESDSDVSSKGQRVSRGDGAFRGSSPPRWAFFHCRQNRVRIVAGDSVSPQWTVEQRLLRLSGLVVVAVAVRPVGVDLDNLRLDFH